MDQYEGSSKTQTQFYNVIKSIKILTSRDSAQEWRTSTAQRNIKSILSDERGSAKFNQISFRLFLLSQKENRPRRSNWLPLHQAEHIKNCNLQLYLQHGARCLDFSLRSNYFHFILFLIYNLCFVVLLFRSSKV